jgi:hypothetical protein
MRFKNLRVLFPKLPSDRVAIRFQFCLRDRKRRRQTFEFLLDLTRLDLTPSNAQSGIDDRQRADRNARRNGNALENFHWRKPKRRKKDDKWKKPLDLATTFLALSATNIYSTSTQTLFRNATFSPRKRRFNPKLQVAPSFLAR